MPVLDLRSCEPSLLLYGGRAGRKEGILIDGEPWIAKYPRTTRDLGGKGLPSYTTSPASEFIGSHIYATLGIPVHDTALGYRNGKVVCACRDFTADGSRLFEFNKVKTTLDDDLDGFQSPPSDGEAAYLSDVLATIETSPVLRSVPGALERFWDMFVIDALIKNPDRNNGNWGLLLHRGRYRLAPVYDNGSSLFPKRSDLITRSRLDNPAALEEDAFGTNVSAYLLPDPNGHARHIHPFEYMARSSNPDLKAAMARVAAAFDVAAIAAVFEEVPEEAYGWPILSPEAKRANIQQIRLRFEKGVAPLL